MSIAHGEAFSFVSIFYSASKGGRDRRSKVSKGHHKDHSGAVYPPPEYGIRVGDILKRCFDFKKP